MLWWNWPISETDKNRIASIIFWPNYIYYHEYTFPRKNGNVVITLLTYIILNYKIIKEKKLVPFMYFIAIES